MADSSLDGFGPYYLSSDFDFEKYYGEDYAGPESTPDVEPRAHNGFESLGEPSQPPIRTGNESLHECAPPLDIENPNAEFHHIEEEPEEVEVRLKRCELERRRRESLQILPTEHQAQIYERPGSMNLNTSSKRSSQLTSQSVTSNDASQTSHLVVSTVLGLT